MKENKNKVITVRLDDKLDIHVKEQCSERKLKKSDYIRELIELDKRKITTNCI